MKMLKSALFHLKTGMQESLSSVREMRPAIEGTVELLLKATQKVLVVIAMGIVLLFKGAVVVCEVIRTLFVCLCDNLYRSVQAHKEAAEKKRATKVSKNAPKKDPA